MYRQGRICAFGVVLPGNRKHSVVVPFAQTADTAGKRIAGTFGLCRVAKRKAEDHSLVETTWSYPHLFGCVYIIFMIAINKAYDEYSPDDGVQENISECTIRYGIKTGKLRKHNLIS